MSHIESWKDDATQSHRFRGCISYCDISMDPREVVDRVKTQLVGKIVEKILEDLSPRLDAAIASAFQKRPA